VPSALLFAHITIWPKESAPGARERYTMRVPNEKQVPTVRIEGEFPPELNIYDFEFKPGWKIDFKEVAPYSPRLRAGAVSDLSPNRLESSDALGDSRQCGSSFHHCC
jgi:hypothetical protein